tara:strand:- start:2360 stop:3100 length:741 start_codon:yes stop_codon:yes gene_type:complete
LRKSLLILFITSLLIQKGFAWSFSNKDPKKGILGITFTPIKPTGGRGHIFEDKDDYPHSEYGISGGIDYWKKYLRVYDFHIGFDVKYQQYHFHFGSKKNNGEHQFLHLSIPTNIQYPIPSYEYMFLKIGLSISSSNLLRENIGFAGENKYITSFKTTWLIYPEINLGFDIIEEKYPRFYLRCGIDYTFIPFPKMGEFKTSISSNGSIETVSGNFSPNKFQLKISFYPIWKKKISFLKKGHDCPNPF